MAVGPYGFLVAAFLVGTAVALCAGPVGYFVVLRREAFAADTLGHVAFTGSLGALVLGWPPLAGLIGGTAFAGLAIGLLGERARARDEVIGTILAGVLGVGVLCASLYAARGSASNSVAGVNVLFGSIFGVSAVQVGAALVSSGVVLLALLALARPLLFASVDPEVAAARGVPVRAVGVAFMVLTGICVAAAVPAVGALLVLSLLVIPGAIAQHLPLQPFRALACSAGLAVLLLWASLAVATVLPVPPSVAVAILSFAAYVATLARARAARPRPRRLVAPA